jgi:hypothetical protein
LRNALGPRLVELPDHSIEEYVPDSVYERTPRTKQSALEAIAAARGDRPRLSELKREISASLAQAVTDSDFDEMPALARAVELAIAVAEPE